VNTASRNLSSSGSSQFRPSGLKVSCGRRFFWPTISFCEHPPLARRTVEFIVGIWGFWMASPVWSMETPMFDPDLARVSLSPSFPLVGFMFITSFSKRLPVRRRRLPFYLLRSTTNGQIKLFSVAFPRGSLTLQTRRGGTDGGRQVSYRRRLGDWTWQTPPTSTVPS
jgi:hypothetical protein